MVGLGKPCQPRYFPGIEPRRDDLKGRSSGLREFPHQLLQAAATQAVAGGVGEHGAPAGPPYPTHDLGHIRPGDTHMAAAATRQEALKGDGAITCMTLIHQPVGDVGAAHHPLANQDLPRIAKPRLGQGLDDGGCPGATNLLQTPKSALQRLVGRIDIQPDYVDGETLPRHRNLHTGHQDDPVAVRGGRGLCKPRYGVVVGERQNLHSDACRAGDQGRGA